MNKFNNGFLTELKEYRDAVDSMKIKVLRRYANKTALAARKDAFINLNRKNEGANAKFEKEEKYGNELKQSIEEKIEKIKNDVQPILKSLYRDRMINRVEKEEAKELEELRKSLN